eukprot:GHRR01015279.1.p1 GENE.GHRR01015279.1~~GHRR01015279.1.p1  ORF type:complete len:130 (-),score=35.90 GHRR01015279.1:1281-1670(-)
MHNTLKAILGQSQASVLQQVHGTSASAAQGTSSHWHKLKEDIDCHCQLSTVTTRGAGVKIISTGINTAAANQQLTSPCKEELAMQTITNSICLQNDDGRYSAAHIRDRRSARQCQTQPSAAYVQPCYGL